MSEALKRDLMRAAGDAPRSELSLDQLHKRRERWVRRRKAGVITLSLALAVATFSALAYGIGPAAPHAAGPGGAPAYAPVQFPAPAGLDMAPGEYFYRRIQTYPGTDAPTTMDVWWATDDSGRLRYSPTDDTTYGPGAIPTDSGPVAYLSTDAATLEQQMVDRMSVGGVSPEPFAQFTPGPGQPDHTTAGMIRSIGELLDDRNTSPTLRAALFRVTAGLAGVETTTNTVDPVGRPAIELTVTTEDILHHWWFDPTSQQLLARSDGPASTADPIEIVEVAGIVSSAESMDTSPSFVSPPVHAMHSP